MGHDLLKWTPAYLPDSRHAATDQKIAICEPDHP
jgi:hypothetical protein